MSPTFYLLKKDASAEIYCKSSRIQSAGILRVFWLLPAFMIPAFYSSIIRAQLISQQAKYIETISDLANAKNIHPTCEKNTANQEMLQVSTKIKVNVKTLNVKL